MAASTSRTSQRSSLSDFLWDAPMMFHCRFTDAAKHRLLSLCYGELWGHNTARRSHYFFDTEDAFKAAVTRLGKLSQDDTEMDTSDAASVWHSNGLVPQPDLSSQRGRPCGHVFRKGEPVYRCRNCGLDDTCVFCSNCFHATDHDGHDVLFSISTGSGCCDCGDAEAWKVPLQCQIHAVDPAMVTQSHLEAFRQQDAELYESMQRTIATVLDFLLEVFALAPEEVALPASVDQVVKEDRHERHLVERQASSGSSSLMGSGTLMDDDVDMDRMDQGGDASDEEYACIAWNDEAHAFSHVLESIVSATGYDWDKAKRMVDAIHIHGREVIALSNNVEDLRKIAAPLAAINFGVTIRPARSTFREQAAGLLVQWIKDLVCGPCRFFAHVPGGDTLMRDLIAQELYAEWELRPALQKRGIRTAAPPAASSSSTTTSSAATAAAAAAAAAATAAHRGTTTTATTTTATTGAAASQLRHPIMLDGGASFDEDVDMYDATQDFSSSHRIGSPAGSDSPTSSSGASPPSGSITYLTDIATIDWDPAATVVEYRGLMAEEEAFADSLLMHPSYAQGKQPAVQQQEAAHALANQLQQEFEQKLRIDYFMLYDLKLWKEIRVALREIYIATLAANPTYKKTLGKRLTRNYARLAESFLLKDREPENSIILFSVQLLTVPSVSDLLVNQYYFFGLICSTLTAFFLTDHLSLLLPSELALLPSRINCESRAFRTRRYFNAFHDLRYIMNVHMIKPVLAQDPLYLRQYLDLIGLFQGMNAQVCQKDTHVEYESEIWVNAFNVTLQIAKCCRQYADCFGALPIATHEDRVASAAVLVRSLNRVLKKIADWGNAATPAVASSSSSSAPMEDSLTQTTTTTTTTGTTTGADPVRTRAMEAIVNATHALLAAANANDDKTKLIGGIHAQTYHLVSLPNMSPFQVIQYDVASQPVSFHHPLHWLLAGLLEHAHLLTDDLLAQAGWTDGFYSAISLFTRTTNTSINGDKNNPTTTLLAILDYPLRTLVFSSQIRAGVWVRNGYGLRTQAHHYREISLRENTYDADLFLMQLGLVTVGSNILLTTMMDRFGLVGWFQGATEHAQYDAVQTVFMVEELLSLLILCLCEHGNVLGASIQQRIQREIIHNLCTGASSYSELTKRIPERLVDHASFDHLLNELAHFRAPDGLHDSGRYELKDEHFDAIDPYFCHYSRNHREEAENVLRARWKKRVSPDTPDDQFFVTPKVTVLPEGPFKYLGSVLHAPVMTQILAFSLWNARDSYESDTILDKTLYLLMLAVTDPNHQPTDDDGFYRHCIDQRYDFTVAAAANASDAANENAATPVTTQMSLFEVITTLRQDDACKIAHPRLDWLLSRLEAHPLTQPAVHAWRTALENAIARAAAAIKEEAAMHPSENASENADHATESEADRKKRAAKERQAMIMAQFAQAQSQFLELNEGLYDDVDPEDQDQDQDLSMNTDASQSQVPADEQQQQHHDRLCAYPVGTCIVCQEEVHERSSPYGLLGLVQSSNILLETPMEQTKVYQDALQMGPTLTQTWPDDQVLPESAPHMEGFPSQLHKTGLYASTCGHLMHIKCFDVYCASIDSRHASQLTRNHPENRTRKEFMCPLCKSLGNTLLPLFWKGKKVSKTRCVANASDASYDQFIHHGGPLAVHQLHQLLAPPTSSASLSPQQQQQQQGSSNAQAAGAGGAGAMAMAAVNSMIGTGRRHSSASKFKEQLAIWLAGEEQASPSSSSSQQQTQQQQQQTNAFASHSSMFGANASALGSPPPHLVLPLETELLHASAQTHMSAIKNAYTRLMDVLGILYEQVSGDDAIKELSASSKHVDLLWGLMGYTINAVEIAARGQPVPPFSPSMEEEEEESQEDGPLPPTGTLFDTIAPQTQMLLRILGDTVAAYTHLLCQDPQPTQRIQLMGFGRLRQIFANVVTDDSKLDLVYDNTPLLEDDPFMLLVELAMYLTPLMPHALDIANLTRILFLAELTKITVSFLEHGIHHAAAQWTSNANVSVNSAEKAAVRAFVHAIAHAMNIPSPANAADDAVAAIWTRLLQSFSLPFLRRALLLFIVRFGYQVDTQTMIPAASSQQENDEFHQTLQLLRLPSLDRLLTLNDRERSLVHTWCTAHRHEVQRRQQVLDIARISLPNATPTQSMRIVLDLPTPLHLIPLPARLDRLFDESLQRVCAKCHTVPNDPALCLFCGTFVCCQSFCCSEDEEGECNLHSLECGGDIGIFLSVKRCVLILLHNGNGWFMNAPYLDAHGEVDQNLRRGRPQYLNAKRYAEIRRLWLQHQIPIYVARQIEATYDIGGWSTL
ncbi:hypothetical protein BC940DRAFT_349914 [Gongronella butleri]|nr:hypothetical protein BC940DRAFT_349914 [Gongronella butleri]